MLLMVVVVVVYWQKRICSNSVYSMMLLLLACIGLQLQQQEERERKKSEKHDNTRTNTQCQWNNIREQGNEKWLQHTNENPTACMLNNLLVLFPCIEMLHRFSSFFYLLPIYSMKMFDKTNWIQSTKIEINASLQ